jgi:hypothetical protein
MRRRALATFAAGVLALSPALAACDREDRADVRDVGRDIEQEVDQLDKDGKDD